MLTAKQDNFCIAFVELGNSQEAYKRAYPTSKNWNPNTLRSKAGQMFKHGAILARIEELKAPVIAKASCTLEEHLNRLDHLSRLAEGEKDFGPAITAETNRGRVAGHYTEKIKLSADSSFAELLAGAKKRREQG